jgi:hypothetical protein
MSVGEVLGDTWELYKKHFGHFIPIALVYFLILSGITLLLTLVLGLIGALLSAFVSLVGAFWLQGTLVTAIADVRDGRADLSIGETFGRARPHIWSLLGAGLLAAIGITIGLILLIVPGLILLTWWSLIIPLIVLEGVSVMDSFGRSRELVRGHGWTVFGVLVVVGLLLIAASIVITLIFVWLPDEARSYISSVVSNTLLIPFGAIAVTLMYYKLAREDAGVEPLEPGPVTT